MRLKNKVALITGSSRGIGRATAILFAKEGAKVVVNYKENKKEAEKVVKQIGKENCLLCQADVTDEKDVKKLTTQTIKQFGGIDILVNNAGEIFRPGDWHCGKEIWQKTIDVNLTSSWLMIKEVAPFMLKKSGSIVNTVSVYGFLGAAPVLA